MIINEYDFDNVESNKFYYTLADHHRTIVTDIIKSCNNYFINYHKYPDIFVGFNGLNALQDSIGYNFVSLKFPNSYNAPVGSLMGKTIYCDLRLKSNEVIVGQAKEITSFLVKKERKQKI